MHTKKIDIRLLRDHIALNLDPLEKLIWYSIVLNQNMTFMGAGILPVNSIANFIGTFESWGKKHITQEDYLEQYIQKSLQKFQESNLIIRDNDLIIIKNKLIYDPPSSPELLFDRIHECEALPRSSAFYNLYTYLLQEMSAMPEWLFAGLLKPLSEKLNRSLEVNFWERVNRKKLPIKITRVKNKKELQKLPADFCVADHHRELALKNNWPKPDDHIDAFKDFHLSKGNKYADWDRAFYTWLRNVKERQQNFNKNKTNRSPYKGLIE